MSVLNKKLNKKIVLVGLMGAGKTSIGQELARVLDLPFVDSDHEIERAAGYSVSEIFDKFGEVEFRKGESKVIARLLSEGPLVLATGGGAFIQPYVRSLVKEKNDCISVWLKASLETLVQRTSLSKPRPLLEGANATEKLEVLMKERYPIYNEADITILVDKQNPQIIASKIKLKLEKFISKHGEG